MSGVVSLREFVDQMGMVGDEWSVYLNHQTGEFLNVSAEDIQAAEEEDVEEDDELLPKWQQEWKREVLPKVREALGSNDWLPLPSKFEIHEYAIMQEYCLSIDDPMLREDLCDTIRGSGAFGRFKSMADRHGLIDAWYQHRDQAFQEIAIAWLEEHGIPHGP